jgi:ribosomal protein L7/L12
MPFTLVIALVAAFLAGFILGRRGSRQKIVWTRPIEAVATPDVQALIQQGKKIDAIKLYRQLHGTGLKDAKEAVEKLERQQNSALH